MREHGTSINLTIACTPKPAMEHLFDFSEIDFSIIVLFNFVMHTSWTHVYICTTPLTSTQPEYCKTILPLKLALVEGQVVLLACNCSNNVDIPRQMEKRNPAIFHTGFHAI